MLMKWGPNVQFEIMNKNIKYPGKYNYYLHRLIDIALTSSKPVYIKNDDIIIFADPGKTNISGSGGVWGYYDINFQKNENLKLPPIFKNTSFDEFEQILKQMGFKKIEI